MDFSLDLEIEDYFIFITVLYFNFYSSFNFFNFIFALNMIFLVLMVEMVGKEFYRVDYWM